MTEIENAIPFSGIDPRGKRLKFSVLLEMFQEMADIDAMKYGLSVRQTISLGVTWSYRVDLAKYPAKEDGPLRIKTYAEIYRNLFLAFIQDMELCGRFYRFSLHVVGADRYREKTPAAS